MPAPTGRVIARIERDFARGTAKEVVDWLTGLSEEAYGNQSPERVQAALILVADGSWDRFRRGIILLHTDWRDLLVAGGLAYVDWPRHLEAEFPEAEFPEAALPEAALPEA